MSNLKCCPFCGGEVNSRPGYGQVRFFECKDKANCGAIVSFDSDVLYKLHNTDGKAYRERNIERFNAREREDRLEALVRDMYREWEQAEIDKAARCGYDRVLNPSIYELAERMRELGIEV